MTTIGWIGTGVMGVELCKHILKANYPLLVNNRTPEKAQPLLELGAQWCQPVELASRVDVLFIMLGFPKDVEQLLLGPKGLLQYMKKGSILVDHTTNKPQLSVQIYHLARTLSIHSIDAPVSGGDIGAKKGELVAMCGGDSESLEKVKPIMEKYTRGVRLCGGPGQGQQTKLTNQIIIANNIAGTVEGLLYASKIGLDLHLTVDTIAVGGASSNVLTWLGHKMADGDDDAGVTVQMFLKDLNLIMEECDRMELSLPCLSLIRSFYLSLKAQGGGRIGLIRCLQNLNNCKLTE